MSDANSPAVGASAPSIGPAKNGGGGQLRALSPNSLKGWIDDDLQHALELAAATPKKSELQL